MNLKNIYFITINTVTNIPQSQKSLYLPSWMSLRESKTKIIKKRYIYDNCIQNISTPKYDLAIFYELPNKIMWNYVSNKN